MRYIILLIYFIAIGACGQVNWKGANPSVFLEKEVNKLFRASNIPDSNQILTLCRMEGYYRANLEVDSLISVKLGPRLSWSKVEFVFKDTSSRKLFEFLNPSFVGDVSQNSIKDQISKIVNWASANGYPFYKIYWSNIMVVNDSLESQLVIDFGPFTRFGEIKNLGGLKLENSYLQGLLDWKEGKAFDVNVWYNIDKRIKSLLNGKILKGHTTVRKLGFIDVEIFVDAKPINQLEGIAGFTRDAGISAGIILNGHANLLIYNAFNHNSRTEFTWRGMQGASQTAHLQFNYPFMLGLKLGPSYTFDLHRQDSAFANIMNEVGVDYYLTANTSIGLSLINQRAVVLNMNPAQISSMMKLPSQLDFSINSYRVSFNYQQQDDFIFPREGSLANIKMDLGLKKTIINGSLIAYDPSLANLYQDFEEEMVLGFDASAAWWGSIKRHTFLQEGRVFSKRLDRRMPADGVLIGGMQSLFGFDQLSLNWIEFYTLRNGYQFYFQKNANIGIYYDLALAKEEHVESLTFYEGVAFGFEIGGPVGKLSAAYAMGRRAGGNFQFNNAKIHMVYKQYL